MSQTSQAGTGMLRPRTRNCPECRKEILLAAKSCNFCGKKVDSYAQQLAKAAKPKKRSKRKEYQWTVSKQLVGALMILALIAFILYQWYKPL
jgi:predicted amidophosphoribosyltransferase